MAIKILANAQWLLLLRIDIRPLPQMMDYRGIPMTDSQMQKVMKGTTSVELNCFEGQ